jgi:hypothetical protein
MPTATWRNAATEARLLSTQGIRAKSEEVGRIF